MNSLQRFEVAVCCGAYILPQNLTLKMLGNNMKGQRL